METATTSEATTVEVWFSVTEAEKHCGLSYSSLWRAVDAGEGGSLINPSNLRNRSFARLLIRAELSDQRITFHDLRHTCASLLFQRKIHPKFVQELLGHANVSITLDTYSHMLPGMDGEVASAIGEALG